VRPLGFAVVVLFVLALWAAQTYLARDAQEWLVLAMPVAIPAALVAGVVAVRWWRGRNSA
jgi:hypothetical protein